MKFKGKSVDRKVCEWVLAADEKIRFVMAIDGLGNLLCLKTLGYYEIPEDLALRIGDAFAISLGGIFRELSLVQGAFEYAIVKHGNMVTVGLKVKEGEYLIFIAKEEETPEIIQKVKETVKLYVEKVH